MSDARQRVQWDQLSVMLSLTANCHSAKGRFKPADFNPFAQKKSVIKDTVQAMSLLKSVMDDKQKRGKK
jgi:hypothetical protein